MGSIFQELWYTERYTADTVNADRFKNRYFEMKRLDAAQRAADARRFNKYEGPTTLPYSFEPRSRIRERVLLKTLERVRDPMYPQGALEPEERRRARSLDTKQRVATGLPLRGGAESRLMRQLALIRQQDAAADAEERAFARSSPLQQAKRRDGWFRVTALDRKAAILGMLQRERRQVSPLTREASGRAKAIAASRGLADPYVVTQSDLQVPVLDPCIEYQLRQKRRRETFFARGMIVSGGYPGPRENRNPC